jgi:hypothetical protein
MNLKDEDLDPVLKWLVFEIECEFLFSDLIRERDDLGCWYLEGLV